MMAFVVRGAAAGLDASRRNGDNVSYGGSRAVRASGDTRLRGLRG